MLTVSNALLMSSATVIVRSGGLLWLKIFLSYRYTNPIHCLTHSFATSL